MNWDISIKIVKGYKSLYSGTFLMTVAICNLLSIPYVQYSESILNTRQLKNQIIIQILINLLYQIDLIFVFLIFGWKRVLFKMSICFKVEVVIQIFHYFHSEDYHTLFNLNDDDKCGIRKLTNISYIFVFLQLSNLLRLSRIFLFLQELKQW